MAPDAEHEESQLVAAGAGSCRVGPAGCPAARAWAEAERLLPGPAARSLQQGLSLGVCHQHRKTHKYLNTKESNKLVTNKLQKRKEQIYAEFKLPLFILTIIFVLIVVHAAKTAWLARALAWSPRAWRREPWRLLTYSLLHGDNTHLALNAIVALAVGWCLEREQRWWRVMMLWSGGVVAGALGAGALQPSVHVVGASAAVYALLTGHIANVCLRFGHIPLWWFRPLSVLVIVASEGCWALFLDPSPPISATLHSTAAPALHLKAGGGHIEQIAWSSHLLGAVVGIPLAFLVFTGENSSTVRIKICRFVSAIVLSVGFVLVALKNTIWMQ